MAVKYGKKVRELMIEELGDLFKGEKGFVFSSYQNIKASDIDNFRKKVKKQGSRYVVLKKRLTKRAMADAKIEGFADVFTEKRNVGVAVIKSDPVALAKLLVAFAKENNNFKVLSGYLEGQAFGADKVKELAHLPSREVLLAMVFGTMKAPITGFVTVLASVLRSLLYALSAVKDKKGS